MKGERARTGQTARGRRGFDSRGERWFDEVKDSVDAAEEGRSYASLGVICGLARATVTVLFYI